MDEFPRPPLVPPSPSPVRAAGRSVRDAGCGGLSCPRLPAALWMLGVVRGQPRPLGGGFPFPSRWSAWELPACWSSSGEGTRCPGQERGCGIWRVGSGGGSAGWEACQGMCGVVEGKGEGCVLAPAGRLGVCVGLVWFARRSWGRWDAVSVLEKKRENSFSIARSDALFPVVLEPFPEKQNSCTRSWSGHLTKQTFSTGKEFEHSVHCRRINAEGSLTNFWGFF